MPTNTIELTEITYNELIEEVRTRGITPEEWIRSYLPLNGHQEESEETVGERLERLGLIGMIDSSQPDDPDSPPNRSLMYQLIAEKYRKQGLKLP
ncbi:MAG: hypothetical protein M3X11_18315 [Acidobacteriota bacterium]|nr:hypothetical protein [Acidobacteriota bacterium]